MLSCPDFCRDLQERGVTFFAGVPDSLLRELCAYLNDTMPAHQHIITPNEAIALAVGYHVASERLPLVYMQNSGLGNAVNPLTSVADDLVYAVPMLLLIGWRGQPGHPDEPQHARMGQITPNLLEALTIPFRVLPGQSDQARGVLDLAVEHAWAARKPVALLVPSGTFAPYTSARAPAWLRSLTREASLRLVLEHGPEEAVFVATTGKLSRELYECRPERGRDFLMVGGMGHASHVALGIALERPERTVVCLDGDGAVLMHMGALAGLGSLAPPNLRHVIFNNACHESVGGQPTVADRIDLPAIARACGYPRAWQASGEERLRALLPDFYLQPELALLEVQVAQGARANLGRPKASPERSKTDLMQALRQTL